MDKYVFFDIDGTLNETDRYAVPAYQKALKKRGIDASREDVIACIGLSPEAIIERLFGALDDSEREEWRADIKEYEFAIMEETARTFVGIPKTLTELKEQGYKLVICSNAYPEHIEKVLNVLGIRRYFDIIGSLELGNSKVETLKNLLKKYRAGAACLAGDRKFDIEAARMNGIPVIGCAYGYAPEEIQTADIIVRKASEIPAAVAELLG